MNKKTQIINTDKAFKAYLKFLFVALLNCMEGWSILGQLQLFSVWLYPVLLFPLLLFSVWLFSVLLFLMHFEKYCILNCYRASTLI